MKFSPRQTVGSLNSRFCARWLQLQSFCSLEPLKVMNAIEVPPPNTHALRFLLLPRVNARAKLWGNKHGTYTAITFLFKVDCLSVIFLLKIKQSVIYKNVCWITIKKCTIGKMPFLFWLMFVFRIKNPVKCKTGAVNQKKCDCMFQWKCADI